MNRFLVFLAATFLAFAFVSCNKDLQINDDYKDITIVYGLLNPNDSLSYIRIEKAFLSDGDIYQAAQIPDSNLYSHKLDVVLYDDDGDAVVTFDTVTIYNKEEGIFYAPVMQVYYAVTKNLLNDEDVYTLKIKNPKTGLEQVAKTKLINGQSIKIGYPNYKIDFTKDRDIEFTTKKNIRLYQVNIRFHYEEININTHDTTKHYVDWLQGAIKSQYLSGGEELESPYSGQGFYDNLENNLSGDDIIRYVLQVEIILSVADDIFNTYMDINKPSASLVVDRPAFSNITNGYGIVASRSQKLKNTTLSGPSQAKLISIADLHFKVRPPN